MFQPLQHLMPRAANKMGIGREFLAVQICHAANQILKDIFPQTGPYKIRSQSFQKGQLIISAPTSAYNQEIMMRKEDLIKSINAKMGRRVVRGLRTLLNS